MAESESNEFRLPDNVAPLNYKIVLEPNFDNFTFTGLEQIDIEVRESTSRIILNAADLEIVSAFANQNVAEFLTATITQDKENETLTLDFRKPLALGKARLVIDFRGTISDNLMGFYRAKYTTPDGTERYIGVTQFEAIDARRAFPCFDEPASKATFGLKLTIPKNCMAISNMPIAKETVIGPEFKQTQFQQTPKMPTYLLAFIVGDLEYIEGHTKNGTLVRVFATPGKKEQCRFALEIGVRALQWYEDYFDIPYPLPKLDMAAIPDFGAGAMENWGLITYREPALLLDPENSSISTKINVAWTVAHELAHQWFGNLVTMQWWDNLWLNESFATWVSAKALDHLFPEWKIWEQFTNATTSALAMDGLKSTHPIEVPIHDPKEINQIFDAISYEKGSAILRMLENYLGEDKFRNGLRSYLAKHQYGNVCTEDLWNALSETSRMPVAELMDTWTKQPGYPVIEAETNVQKRFTYIPQDSDQSWLIPTAAINGVSWIKLNANQAGFYRVHYSPAMLTALYPAIQSKELSTLDRMGLLDDAYALQKARMMPATQYLELAEHYRDETEYAVWNNLCSGLRGVAARLANEPYYTELEKFFKSLLEKTYRDVGWEAVPHEDELKTLLRSLIIVNMGYYGHRGAKYTARRKFFHFLLDKQSLDPNLRGAVSNIAAQYGTEAIYEALLDLYREAESQEEKSRYLHALGYFRNEKLLKETLRFAMSPEVRSQETVRVIAAVAENPNGKNLAWEFVKANWQELEGRYGEGNSSMLSRLIEGTVLGFDTLEKKQEVQEFFAAHPVPAATMALERALESIDINIAWLERNRDAVGEWLRNR